jgi:stress-induced morphogen
MVSGRLVGLSNNERVRLVDSEGYTHTHKCGCRGGEEHFAFRITPANFAGTFCLCFK